MKEVGEAEGGGEDGGVAPLPREEGGAESEGVVKAIGGHDDEMMPKGVAATEVVDEETEIVARGVGNE